MKGRLVFSLVHILRIRMQITQHILRRFGEMCSLIRLSYIAYFTALYRCVVDILLLYSICSPTLSDVIDSTIIYNEQSSDGTGIFIMKPDGTNRTFIIPTVYNSTPRWNQNGQKIVYGQGYLEYYDFSLGSSYPIETDGIQPLNPAWSPNG